MSAISYPPAGSALSAATQAEQEAGSSTTAYTTPGRQQYHPSAAKAWVRFNGTGTLAVNSSYNVDSVSDGGTGIYTINFGTDFADTEYMPLPYTDLALGATPGTARGIELHTLSAGALTVRTHPINSATLEDHECVCVGCWGDQA